MLREIYRHIHEVLEFRSSIHFLIVFFLKFDLWHILWYQSVSKWFLKKVLTHHWWCGFALDRAATTCVAGPEVQGLFQLTAAVKVHLILDTSLIYLMIEIIHLIQNTCIMMIIRHCPSWSNKNRKLKHKLTLALDT